MQLVAPVPNACSRPIEQTFMLAQARFREFNPKPIMQELDSHNAEHAEYWGALALVADAELAEAQRQDDADRARMRGEAPPPDARAGAEAGLHGAVDADIHLMLAGAPADETVSWVRPAGSVRCSAEAVGSLQRRRARDAHLMLADVLAKQAHGFLPMRHKHALRMSTLWTVRSHDTRACSSY